MRGPRLDFGRRAPAGRGLSGRLAMHIAKRIAPGSRCVRAAATEEQVCAQRGKSGGADRRAASTRIPLCACRRRRRRCCCFCTLPRAATFARTVPVQTNTPTDATGARRLVRLCRGEPGPHPRPAAVGRRRRLCGAAREPRAVGGERESAALCVCACGCCANAIARLTPPQRTLVLIQPHALVRPPDVSYRHQQQTTKQIAPVVDASSSQSRADVLGIVM